MKPSDHDVDEIARRAASALQAAKATVATSARLLDAHHFLGDDDAMITRCAWCGRLRLADAWLEPKQMPRFLAHPPEERTTHGICGACLGRLRANGDSR